MTWMVLAASLSLAVCALALVWAGLAWLNVQPPSRGIVTWRGKPYNPKEDE